VWVCDRLIQHSWSDYAIGDFDNNHRLRECGRGDQPPHQNELAFIKDIGAADLIREVSATIRDISQLRVPKMLRLSWRDSWTKDDSSNFGPRMTRMPPLTADSSEGSKHLPTQLLPTSG
jgi:hypothetical protein